MWKSLLIGIGVVALFVVVEIGLRLSWWSGDDDDDDVGGSKHYNNTDDFNIDYIDVRNNLGIGFAADVEGRHNSCKNRCGDNKYSIDCQCNVECFDMGDCCSDYEARCFTCQHRCTDESPGPGAPCECDAECASRGNCCDDFLDICSATHIVGNISDSAIRTLTENLYNLDKSNMDSYITINMQGETKRTDTNDVAPLPLFSNVSLRVLNMPTVQRFEALMDNYNRDVTKAEDNTPAEQAEVTAFLDAVFATPLMRKLASFVHEKRIIHTTLRNKIHKIWFTPYSRDGNVLGSSGFEHVFIGELHNGVVGGFHNWINFFREEQAGNINYMGYIKYRDLGEVGYVFKTRFTWFGGNNEFGGGYIGTSPEFELAIKTLCFLLRPNSLCPVETNGQHYHIQTFEFGDNKMVGAAYTVI